MSRRTAQWLIWSASIVLTVLAVVLSLRLDAGTDSFAHQHPITANLIAGGLGLPAAFLIVNLAAQWGINWAEDRQWDLVRNATAASVHRCWDTLRPALVARYSLEGTNKDIFGRELKTCLDAVEQEWSARINATDGHGKGTATRTTDEMAELLWTIDGYTDGLRIVGTGRQEEVYRAWLLELLRRFDDSHLDPDILVLGRGAVDALLDLSAAWSDFEDVYPGPYFYLTSEDRGRNLSNPDWLTNLENDSLEEDLHRLTRVRALFREAQEALAAVDNLVAALPGK